MIRTIIAGILWTVSIAWVLGFFVVLFAGFREEKEKREQERVRNDMEGKIDPQHLIYRLEKKVAESRWTIRILSVIVLILLAQLVAQNWFHVSLLAPFSGADRSITNGFD